MTYKWKKHFPYSEFRKGQDTTIDKIINSLEGNKRFAIIEAPTGAGKSAIGYTIGSYFDSYYYITAQKILQSQLNDDFGQEGKWSGNKPMVELKGRNAYECIYYKEVLDDQDYRMSKDKRKNVAKKSKEYVNCAEGECKRQSKSSLEYCKGICPYYMQFNSAINSKSVLMNFHSFIFQTEFVKKWPHKTVLIIDEAHNAEQVLMDYVSFRFNDVSYNFKLPKLDTAEEYYMYFEDIGMTEIIADKLREAIKDGNTKDEEYWVQQAFKYKEFAKSISTHEWIPKWEEKELVKNGNKYRSVELKPLYVSDFAETLLFSKVDCVVMMSATILNVKILCDSLGINRDEVYSTRLKSDFPVKNRPIYFKSCGSMAFRSKNATLPRIMKEIEILCSENNEHKGIIHTHNFEISNYIKNNSSRSLKSRFFFQADYPTKEDMLESHAKSDNGIIVAPAMHEGLDLKDDLARFQIICKMPFPGIGDNPQLKRRMELNSDYYQYLSALKLIQSYGRAVRSNTDWANTYVLDDNFKSFCHRSPQLLPSWFSEAIVW